MLIKAFYREKNDRYRNEIRATGRTKPARATQRNRETDEVVECRVPRRVISLRTLKIWLRGTAACLFPDLSSGSFDIHVPVSFEGNLIRHFDPPDRTFAPRFQSPAAKLARNESLHRVHTPIYTRHIPIHRAQFACSSSF